MLLTLQTAALLAGFNYILHPDQPLSLLLLVSAIAFLYRAERQYTDDEDEDSHRTRVNDDDDEFNEDHPDWK